jgi:predicted nuclease of predicted toxin-antitoxin system
MRFLLDMNLSPELALWLRDQGHDAVHPRDLGQGHLPDRDVLALVAGEDRTLITFDLDFGDLAAAAGGPAVSVVLLRLRAPRAAVLRERIGAAIAHAAGALATGAMVTVEEHRLRIRRLPLGS